ncbi:hypothetical protein FOH10_32955 [Nocardia otitidiscaviarum]|uniref:Uncharacterized protein n=1 Tax=Nocardia otitidiscaviarum TaxID=1823 RepID=A0A516NV88_9NOCA|nr:hypothetical protein [Nocardia otitidiscaviarum]MCP9622266.1 hypothetical protein [Nocardia otitidiscaviarum]QDP82817.1 hypothetical protein FOH10_32955 [Nocardia otitidiscaviarum]
MQVPQQALRFYQRHFLPIAGISLIPGVQRCFVVVTDPSAPVAIPLEFGALAARILLLVLIVRWAFQEGAPRPGHSPSLFLRHRWPSLLIQVALFATAFALCDVVLERVVVAATTGDAEAWSLGLLLLVKNPTVIALALIWVVLGIRQAWWFHPDATTR